MTKPRAHLRIRTLARGVRRFEVDCRYGTTSVMYIPGAVVLTEAALVNFVAYRHEEECGRCNLEPVFAQGDADGRQAVEKAWGEMRRQAMAGRRN